MLSGKDRLDPSVGSGFGSRIIGQIFPPFLKRLPGWESKTNMAFGKNPSIFGRFTPLISGDVSHVSKHRRVCAFVSKARLRLAGELILTMKLIRDLELQRDVFRVVFPEGMETTIHSWKT